jgi:tRNA (mo5U34)-methyltransferase
MEIVDFTHLESLLKQHDLWHWGHELEHIVSSFLSENPHGRTAYWLQILDQLPVLQNLYVELNKPAITVTSSEAIDITPIRQALMTLFPWRKGPFHIIGMDIDTEWRSDVKWDRVLPHIAPLDDRCVLDIGCGNGYYLWRMLGAGARCAIGVDPMRLYAVQFQAIRHFVGRALPATLIPTGIEQLPSCAAIFDTVFSMGVLYHRRDPVNHLQQLISLLRPGGELVLETLIIHTDEAISLQPEERYARMRNVWHIPSLSLLSAWMKQAGLHDIRIIDVSATTPAEQRTTEWMPFHSLSDFLDVNDSSKTVEGYPAPVRAVAIATR